MRHERLAQVIQAHQEALLTQPASQDTHEAILSLLQGVAAGEITAAHCVRLLRHQAVRFVDAPASPSSIARPPLTSSASGTRSSEPLPAPDDDACLRPFTLRERTGVHINAPRLS